MIKVSKIEIELEQAKIDKLKEIINDLFESNSINSTEIKDFMNFTLFIVFDEYEKNVQSLRKFYEINLSNYLEYKSS